MTRTGMEKRPDHVADMLQTYVYSKQLPFAWTDG